jgi:hypothetical protein
MANTPRRPAALKLAQCEVILDRRPEERGKMRPNNGVKEVVSIAVVRWGVENENRYLVTLRVNASPGNSAGEIKRWFRTCQFSDLPGGQPAQLHVLKGDKCVVPEEPAAQAQMPPPRAWRIAEYDGTCPACQRQIVKGVDEIESVMGAGWVHRACVMKTAAIREAAEASIDSHGDEDGRDYWVFLRELEKRSWHYGR